jgi:hypothetical protein
MDACLDPGSALDESQFGLPGLSVQGNCGGLAAELGDALPDKIGFRHTKFLGPLFEQTVLIGFQVDLLSYHVTHIQDPYTSFIHQPSVEVKLLWLGSLAAGRIFSSRDD